VETIIISLCIVLLLIVLVCLVPIFYNLISSKEILAKNIVNRRPINIGDVFLNEEKIEVKGLWSIKQLKLNDLELIKRYTFVTYGLEDTECVDFIFSKSPKILFDISRIDHREFIDLICEKLNDCKPSWDNSFIFTTNIDKEFETMYSKKNCC
jgi:hypothetical protein